MSLQLTPGMICREFLYLLSHVLVAEGINLEPPEQNDGVIRGDLVQRHVEFPIGNLHQSLDDYAEHWLMPHVYGLAALLRMADAWQVFPLPLPEGRTSCRYGYDNISLRLLVDGDNFRIDVLFRPRGQDVRIIKRKVA